MAVPNDTKPHAKFHWNSRKEAWARPTIRIRSRSLFCRHNAIHILNITRTHFLFLIVQNISYTIKLLYLSKQNICWSNTRTNLEKITSHEFSNSLQYTYCDGTGLSPGTFWRTAARWCPAIERRIRYYKGR